MSNKQETNNETESNAIKLFIKLMDNRYKEKGITFTDIHKSKTEEVNADVKATDKNGKTTYFEIKSTKAKEKYWGRIAFGEIISALDAEKKGYKYYFVIIKIDESSNGVTFIFPRNAEKKNPFLTLNEMLKYTNGKFSYGIDFIVKYRKTETEEHVLKDFSTLFAEKLDNVNSYTVKQLEEKRELLEMIANNDRP